MCTGNLSVKLVTLAEWKLLNPKAQGYVLYMQEELPGSELKGQKNPYCKNSSQWKAFNEGQQRACLNVQDSEE